MGEQHAGLLRPATGREDGDLERFRDFYRESLPQVYGYFLHRVGWDTSTAQDLTQDTYLAVVRHLRASDGQESMSMPWVIGVARHKLVDHLRKMARDERKLSLVRDVARSDQNLPSETSDQALAVLSALPAFQRAALALRYLDDLPVHQVAAALDRSVHATESLLARGRAAFRRHYLEGSGV